MFGYWVPEPVYRSKPYILLAFGLWAAIETNPVGVVSGMVLIVAGAYIWKLRR